MKQPSINFIHVCEAASADNLNKLSILGIFNNIYLPSTPNKWPKMCLVASISLGDLSKAEHELELKLFNSKKEEVKLNPPINLKFPPPPPIEENKKRKPELNLILDLQNLEFTEFGKHEFIIVIDKKEIGSKDFLVEQKR
jgi:hypothetical protein